MRISVWVFRVSAILAVAAISVPAARAQSDPINNSAKACADVKPPAANPADTIDRVPLYLIAPGKPSHESVCLATEALAEGMVDISLSDDVVLDDSLGDSKPENTKGLVDEYPTVTGFPFPGSGVESTDGTHAYAAFIDPDTGVEYTFDSVADSFDDEEATGVQWIETTVKPLLEHHAPNANALNVLAAANLPAATANATFAAAAAIGTPSYSTQAWNLLVDATIAMPDNKLASGLINEGGQHFGRILGGSGAVVKVYRLNGNQADSDYFLVDTAYSQTPSYDSFDFHVFVTPYEVYAWGNRNTDFKLTATDPNHLTMIIPALSDFSPQTKVTSGTETFTVGATLSAAAGPGVSAGYSVTRTQQSVDTSLQGTHGTNTVAWSDTYNGFGARNFFGHFETPPASSVNTFSGERLAIFQVPRAVNDNITSGRAGIYVSPSLDSHVQGSVAKFSLAGPPSLFASWNINAHVFVPEPQLSASPLKVTVSRSKNNTGNPVIVDVVAQGPDGGQKVTWKPELKNSYLETNVTASGITGSGQLKIIPTATAVNTTTYVSLDSSPSGATDSVRTKPISIEVTIVN